MPAKRSAPDFAPVFARLKKILVPYAQRMVVGHDTPGNYCLNSTKPHPTNGRPLMFAAVQTGKNYVSFHYMPIYGAPALAASLSPALKRRMQGKACFNFTEVDDALFAELADVTRRGLEGFKQLGLA
jgi:hypothetical protein